MRAIQSWTLLGILTLVGSCTDPADPVDPGAANPSLGQSEEFSATAELKAGPTHRVAEVVTQVNLVSDQAGVAKMTDPGLVNAWGLSFNPTGRAWVSSTEKGTSQVYDDDGNTLLSVTIPTSEGSDEANPTGQVFNEGAASFQGDRFIFVTEQGTVAGWQPSHGTTAMLRVDNSGSGASYKGAALAWVGGRQWLYAADFHNNRIDVYDDQYKPVPGAGRFMDPSLPAGYAPFNVVAQTGLVFVTYAEQDAEKADEVAGPGKGFVDAFDAQGLLATRLVSRGALNAPWGLAFRQSSAEDRSVQMLVGNFGDGRINAYQISFRDFRLRVKLAGALADAAHHPLVIDGLWALAFGPGAGGFDTDELYFTAGPGDEQHGLFGEIHFSDASPEGD
jgi:uncharacterized protein (TIGR03118 family)